MRNEIVTVTAVAETTANSHAVIVQWQGDVKAMVSSKLPLGVIPGSFRPGVLSQEVLRLVLLDVLLEGAPLDVRRA